MLLEERGLVRWSSGTNMIYAHFRNNLLAIALCHALKVEFLAREDL